MDKHTMTYLLNCLISVIISVIDNIPSNFRFHFINAIFVISSWRVLVCVHGYLTDVCGIAISSLSNQKEETHANTFNNGSALKARKETGLIYYSIESIASMFGDYEQGRPGRGIITKTDYNTVMHKLIQSKNTNIKDPEYIEELVKKLYNALSLDGDGRSLVYHDIMIGFVSMSKDNGDEKIKYIYSMITKDARYKGVTLNNMIHYLTITYQVMFVITPGLKAEYPISEIELATTASEDLFMGDVDRVITFEEFKKWYNTIPCPALHNPEEPAMPKSQGEIEQEKYIKCLEKKLEELERDYNNEWEGDSDNDSEYVPGE